MSKGEVLWKEDSRSCFGEGALEVLELVWLGLQVSLHRDAQQLWGCGM